MWLTRIKNQLTKTKMSLPEVPNGLVDALAKGRCVVFVGAGLSQGAGLPGWSQLLDQMIEWSEENSINVDNKSELKDLIQREKFLVVAEDLKERMGDEQFRKFLKEVFSDSKKPSNTQLLLPEIPFSAVITTNYDRLLEMAYRRTRRVLDVFTQENSTLLTESLRQESFYILKAHGSIDQIETVVLGRNEYRQLMHGNMAYRDHLNKIFSLRTVLFLGYTLNDPDLELILDEWSVVAKGNVGTHYALMDSRGLSATEQRSLLRDYGIVALPYEPSDENHPEVRAFLTELKGKIGTRHATGAKARKRRANDSSLSTGILKINLAKPLRDELSRKSRAALARQIGVSPNSLAAMVNDNWQYISRDAIERVSDYLEMPASEVFEFVPVEFWEPIARSNECTFLRGSYMKETCLRIPRYDDEATQRVMQYLRHSLPNCATIYADYREDEESYITRVKQESCVVIGSPRTNPATEILLSRFFNAEPFNPTVENRRKIPFGFC